MTDARGSAYGYWFALFGAHSDPRGRMLCMGTALAFLAFPLADLLSGRLSGGSEVIAALGLAAFAAVFLRLFWILPRSRPTAAPRVGRCSPRWPRLRLPCLPHSGTSGWASSSI